MTVAVQSFSDDEPRARALAATLGVEFGRIELHTFPDGETLPTVPIWADTVLAYLPLNHPNDKLVSLLLAVDAWRRAGVRRLVLVAPYLCYMRQDAVFAAGQPLSRGVIGGLLGRAFDRIVTVEAHLHRTRDLSEMFGGVRAESIGAAEVLAKVFAPALPDTVVVGPDAESAPWTEAVARALGVGGLVLRKQRLGDRAVRIEAPPSGAVTGRSVLLVDDICSSGGTLVAAVEALRSAGACTVDLAVVHALFNGAVERRLRAAGVDLIVSTDSVPHPSNAATLVPLLARALIDEVAP
jgi:ribose-phosphate pyrophosphokinase